MIVPNNHSTNTYPLRSRAEDLIWRRRITSRGVPGRTSGDTPVTVARPEPVRLPDDFAHGFDKYGERAFSVLVLGAAADAREGNNAVVYDDANLWVRGGGAGQH